MIVDNILPYSFGKIAFGCNEDENTLWMAIFEKAYAKLWGGYTNIEGGFNSDIMYIVTGNASTNVDLKKY